MKFSEVQYGVEIAFGQNELYVLVNSQRNLNLPAPTTARWTVSKKAAVVDAFRAQKISIEEIQRLYLDISEEEFYSWCDAYERHDRKGLRVTRTQEYRNKPW